MSCRWNAVHSWKRNGFCINSRGFTAINLSDVLIPHKRSQFTAHLLVPNWWCLWTIGHLQKRFLGWTHLCDLSDSLSGQNLRLVGLPGASWGELSALCWLASIVDWWVTFVGFQHCQVPDFAHEQQDNILLSTHAHVVTMFFRKYTKLAMPLFHSEKSLCDSVGLDVSNEWQHGNYQPCRQLSRQLHPNAWLILVNQGSMIFVRRLWQSVKR